MSEELVTIQIKKSSLEFLVKTAHELNTQDNRSTADPYYFCIQHEERAENSEGDHVVFIDPEDDYEEYESLKEMEAAIEFNYSWEKNLGSNTFLTEKACERHMRQNAHHMGKDAVSFVGRFFRNPEMENVIEVIKETGGLSGEDS